ncbi:hypothetical protein Y032_0012g1746 [Ancylostoma ceylanicum]|uniref:Uncharacterized protein n=1 Tax=Ancylostoma ceylanicum TaxID=53326 RepID=A0A016VEL2_9BILA|nr:hypothetical protein Y032_0012g1746 [Ancylostoma ceylanicum]
MLNATDSRCLRISMRLIGGGEENFDTNSLLLLGACGAVVRGWLRTHTVDGSIARVANQAIHPSGVRKLVPEKSGRMKH